jgi:hypothetical protein
VGEWGSGREDRRNKTAGSEGQGARGSRELGPSGRGQGGRGGAVTCSAVRPLGPGGPVPTLRAASALWPFTELPATSYESHNCQDRGPLTTPTRTASVGSVERVSRSPPDIYERTCRVRFTTVAYLYD